MYMSYLAYKKAYGPFDQVSPEGDSRTVDLQPRIDIVLKSERGWESTLPIVNLEDGRAMATHITFAETHSLVYLKNVSTVYVNTNNIDNSARSNLS